MNSFFRKIRRFFTKLSYIIKGSVLAFISNNDYLKASALTYYTLISIVPFLAVAFGIASGFGFAAYLEEQLKLSFQEQPEVVGYAIQFARSMLQNTQGSVIAGVGVIALLWTNLSMLNNIEYALNQIWKVKQPRSWSKKFADYLAAMIICPIVFVASSSLSVFIATQITRTAKENYLVGFVSPYLLFLLKLTPFLLSILLFIVIYLFIPNTQIRVRPRVIAGIFAGCAFQLWQWLYIRFQVEISSYGVVYGTFAAFPLFLLWLQVSWLILLGGAEMAAHIENEMSHVISYDSKGMRKASMKELGLLTLYRCIRAYTSGDAPMTALQIAQEFGVPLLTVQQMIDILEEGGLLVEVSIRGSEKVGYQPSRDAKLYTISEVCNSIDQPQEWHVDVETSPDLERISKCLQEFETMTKESAANLTLQDIIDQHN